MFEGLYFASFAGEKTPFVGSEKLGV